MLFKPTPLAGLLIVESPTHGDHRGFFIETYRDDLFRAAGITGSFVQDNASRSVHGTLRGLHFQHPYGQGKIVRVTRGHVFDVAVDVRKGSPTFGKWFGCELTEESKQQLWIPAGLAHGFCVLSHSADFAYKCTEYYHPETERTVLWNDAAIGIEWPIESPTLSAKDQAGVRLKDLKDLPEYEE